MKRDRLVKMWQLYQDIVHNTLFFEILNHLHHAFVIALAAVAGFLEQHGTTIAVPMAIAVSLLRVVMGVGHGTTKENGKRKTVQERDKRGRFAKKNRKER